MSSSAELGDQRRIEKEDIMGDNIIYGVSLCVQENVSYLIYLDMLLDYLYSFWQLETHSFWHQMERPGVLDPLLWAWGIFSPMTWKAVSEIWSVPWKIDNIHDGYEWFLCVMICFIYIYIYFSWILLVFHRPIQQHPQSPWSVWRGSPWGSLLPLPNPCRSAGCASENGGWK